MYKTGCVVPPDYGEALKWYGKAADEGDADWQFAVAAMYYEGRGVKCRPR
jgi:TPR repeat protein